MFVCQGKRDEAFVVRSRETLSELQSVEIDRVSSLAADKVNWSRAEVFSTASIQTVRSKLTKTFRHSATYCWALYPVYVHMG